MGSGNGLKSSGAAAVAAAMTGLPSLTAVDLGYPRPCPASHPRTPYTRTLLRPPNPPNPRPSSASFLLGQ